MTDHPMTKIETPPPGWDGNSFTYRGGRIFSNKMNSSAKLELPGHPFDGKYCGNWQHLRDLVDQWLDEGALRPPYARMNPPKT